MTKREKLRAKTYRGRARRKNKRRRKLDRACLRLQTTKKGCEDRYASWSEFANDIREEYFAFALFQTEPGERPTLFYSLMPS